MADNKSRLHSMETYTRADGKRGWRIVVGSGPNADIVATDGGQGYETERDCLGGLFGLFFGEWNESFLDLYAKWQSYAGSQYSVPPEAQEGAPVRVRRDGDAPNYHADDETEGER
jgi:hypothetical protein